MGLLQKKAFYGCFRMGPEVDQKAEMLSGNFQVIQDLGFMLTGDARKSLEFHNYRTVADKVWPVGLPKGLAFVRQLQIRLRNEWNSTVGKFLLQALLINRLKKTASHLTIHLKHSSLYPIALILIKKIIHFICASHAPKGFLDLLSFPLL